MEDRLRFIKHQDKDILFVDLSDASKQDLLILLPRIKAVVTEQPRDSVLILADLSGAKIDKDVATRVKEVLVFDRPRSDTGDETCERGQRKTGAQGSGDESRSANDE